MKKAIKKTDKKVTKKNSKLVGAELITFTFNPNKKGKITIKKPIKPELVKQIKTVKELIKLAKDRKSIYNTKTKKRCIPASFYLYMHFIEVVKMIESGYLFVKK
jgi:hypothetical protein